MKYKNALCILGHIICGINIIYGTHISQENNPKGREETKLIENATSLEENSDASFEAETLDSKADSVDQQNSLSSEETKINVGENSDTGDEIEDNEYYEHNDKEEEKTMNLAHFNSKAKTSSSSKKNKKKASCWMSLNTQSLFNTMDDIDKRYFNIRETIQNEIMHNKFNQKMLQTMLFSEGAAIREQYNVQDHRQLIPAGLNLGGYCMMRMPDSIMFFHRMKLRNDTRFRVHYMDNDLTNMVLTVRLSLNDLHLRGAFERSVTDQESSILFYAPSYGEVDLLMKDVQYKMEGRYRLIGERLMIEVLVSDIVVTDMLMTYINRALDNQPVKIIKENIAEFIERMKTDLDKWLKDYFNDFLIYTELRGLEHLDQLQKYDKEKAIALNEYMDNSIDLIRQRIRERNATVLKLPKFTIMGVNGFQITLRDGVFRGLNSIYRQSVATTKSEGDVRKVDAIVGFSDLKVVYQYDTTTPTVLAPVSGELVLSANELSAHISLTMVKDPETVDIDIDFLDQTKPESLTVGGAANTMISNFKHLLEHQIISVMSNTLVHGIKTLKSLPKCEPFLPGQIYVEKKVIPLKHSKNSGIHHSGSAGPAETNVGNKVAPQTESESNGDEDLRKRNIDYRKKSRRSKKKNNGSKNKNKRNKKKNRGSNKKD